MNSTKKVIALFVLLAATVCSKAQTAITVTSDREDVRFALFIDGQIMNDFFETWVNVKNVPSGFHEMTILFERDSAADYTKNITFNDGFEKTFTISEKKQFKKKVNAAGRSIGKTVDVGTHDAKFEYLLDIYDVKQTAKTPYAGNGSTEIEVSTDSSLSTSILPVQKEK